ncbi:MAG: hypothetical protein ACFFFH_11635 [Candidatus Thorarchaeota archaeon]
MSSDSAESYRTKMMTRGLCKFKESLIGDTGQFNNINGLYPLLAT